MSKARLVITAVVVEGRSQADAARAYGVSKGWVSKLVARYRPIPKPRFQQKKFCDENPELADKYTVTVDEWRLERVK